MPITTTELAIDAKALFDEPLEYDWNGSISVKLNALATNIEFLAEVQELFTRHLAQNPYVEHFNCQVRTVEWRTKAEEKAAYIVKACERIAEIVPDEGATARDAILSEEQAKQFKISSEKLEWLNEALEAAGYDPIDMDEVKGA